MRFRDSRYSAQCSCAVGSEVEFIYTEYFLVLFVPGSSAIMIWFPGLLLDFLQRSSSWLKILMVEKLIVKNLLTLDGLYDNSLLIGAPPHMAILPG